MGSTRQPGLGHSAKVEVSREPICRASRNRFVVDVASTGKRRAGKAAKAGRS
jgi:hypothetical protein